MSSRVISNRDDPSMVRHDQCIYVTKSVPLKTKLKLFFHLEQNVSEFGCECCGCVYTEHCHVLWRNLFTKEKCLTLISTAPNCLL